MNNLSQITPPVSGVTAAAGYRSGFLVGQLVLAAALVAAAACLVLLALRPFAVAPAPQAGPLTPAQQLLALPGATVTAFPDYAVLRFPGAQQAGYGVSYDGEDHTVGTYLVAQVGTHEQAQALADRYFARAARPIRGAGGGLYATPRGTSDVWSYTYVGMVTDACSYGAGFVRGAAFYQLQIVSTGAACKAAEGHLGDWTDRMQATS